VKAAVDPNNIFRPAAASRPRYRPRGGAHDDHDDDRPASCTPDTLVVFGGLLLAMFISALDQTIMATALQRSPAISAG
jgi:hypothetical protein